MRTELGPVSKAIDALTEAARGVRTISAGTPNAHSEPVDFAEIACHVLTAVAADVGGVETLLSGRPGSWEADLVRQIVQSTAGGSADELRLWRTQSAAMVSDQTAQRRDGLDAVARPMRRAVPLSTRDVEDGRGGVVGPVW